MGCGSWCRSRRRVDTKVSGTFVRPQKETKQRYLTPFLRQPFGVRREHGQVVLAGLDGLTRGIVAGRENPAPSQGDLVGRPLLGDVRPIAEHEMEMVAHHGIATNLDGEEPR